MVASPLILLIDSEPTRQRRFSLLLQRAGFLLLCAPNASCMLETAQEHCIALVLVDKANFAAAQSQFEQLNAVSGRPHCDVVVMHVDSTWEAPSCVDSIVTVPTTDEDILAQLSAQLAITAASADPACEDIDGTPLAVALAESHQQLLSILDGMDADVYVADMESHEIIFMNEHMRASFGDDFIGGICWQVFRPSDGPCVDCTNPRLLGSDGLPTGYATWEGLNTVTQRWYLNYDRAIKWVDGRYVRLEVSTDITDRKFAEERLLAERNRAQQYLDISDVIFLAFDTEHKVILANQKAGKLLGVDPDEIIGKPWIDNWVPEDVQKYVQHTFEMTLRGEVTPQQRYRNTVIASDGRERIIDWHNTSMRDDQGNITGILSSGEDVTDRVKTEMALLESEDRLSKTLLATNDGMWDWNLITNEVYFDARYYQMAGYEVDAFPHTLIEFEQRIHPEDHDLVMGQASKHLSGETERFSVEFRFRKATGDYLWILGRGIIVERDGDGTPLRLTGTHTDISLRKAIEKGRENLANQLRAQAQQMEQILATVPTGVILLNGEGRILQANPVAQKDLQTLTGASLGEIITYIGNHKLYDLFTSPTTGVMWHEVRTVDKVYEVIARPVEIGAEPEHWVIAITDVTKSREIQAQLQQQEQLAAVGQLAAGIAHDFNNILASIVLYAQLMGQSPNLHPDLKERVGIIDRQAQSAAQLVEQMLDFSRRSVLARRPLDLLPLVKEQVKLLQRSLPEHISIKLDYAQLEYTVNADPTRMQQMLMNLAVNARDAMPEGGLLTIKLEHLSISRSWSPLLPAMAEGPWICIAVSDTGTGISPDVLPHIFEPFYTTKEPGKGSGLGLAQVHGIVGQHGGRIGVETVEGEGSTFSIYLPAILTEKPVAAVPDEKGQFPGEGQTLLVVEDNSILRTALADSLEQLNYTILTAPDGKAALNILAEHPEIDLVLSDLVMPVMGGQAMFQALRAQGYTLPVLMLTGHPMQQELEGLREQGLAGWMLKPPEIDALSQLIALTLRRTKEAAGY